MRDAMPGGSSVVLEYTSVHHIQEDAVILVTGLIDCWWLDQLPITT